jgi:SHS2 domain-containing protein
VVFIGLNILLTFKGLIIMEFIIGLIIVAAAAYFYYSKNKAKVDATVAPYKVEAKATVAKVEAEVVKVEEEVKAVVKKAKTTVKKATTRKPKAK